MVTEKDVAVAILATFCLTSTLFMAIPIKSQVGTTSSNEYDPWVDINNDGTIDIFDLAALALDFGAEGEPVNKTELLLSLLSRMESLEARVETLEAEVANLTTALAEHEARIAALEAKLQSLYIDGSITIGSLLSELLQSTSSMTLEQGLKWVVGMDSPSDTTINGNTVLIDLDVENGTVMNFTECLFLKNDSDDSFSLLISIPTAVSASDFDRCNIYVYQNSSGVWEFADTLILTNPTGTYSGSLAAGCYLRFSFEVQTRSDTTGSKPFDIQVRYN